MAKKKLNKKVVVIGLLVLVPFVFGGIWYVWYKSLGPQRFIEDGDAAVVAKDYETATKQYGRAFSRAKDNETRKKILFKLADINILSNDWRKAMGCWSKITTIDTSDKISRTKLLDFFYDMADSGQYSAWKQVLATADELLALSPNAKLYLVKGRAKLELAKGGEVPDRVKALDETIQILTQAQKLDPKNPNAYRYLAEAVVEKGGVLASKGSPEEKTKARNNAQKLLEKAIAAAPNDPNSSIELLSMKLTALQDAKQLEALEPDYIALTKKFPKSPDVLASLSSYYFYCYMNKHDSSYFDKALKAAQAAMELNPQGVKYAINAAEMYYRKGSLAKDEKYMQKAIDIAKNALTLPAAQDTQGSREYANKMNKLTLNTFLAYRYTEQILSLPANAPKQQKDSLIAADENSVHEIAQIWGSGEQSYVVAAEGMLAYAKGDTAEGFRKMYTAYTQLKETDTKFRDAQLGQLSYILAEASINSPEIGVAIDCLLNAYLRGVHYTKPDILLSLANAFFQLKDYNKVLFFLDRYEELVKPTAVSKLMRVKADIAGGHVDDAETLLGKMKQDDPNANAARIALLKTKIDQAAQAMDANGTKKESSPIQAEIDKYRNEQVRLAQQLLRTEPNASQALNIVCEDYIKANKVQDAKAVVNGVLTRAPGNIVAIYYKLLLAEPDPNKISQQRRSELMEQAQAAMPDPVTRSLSLANYYRSQGKLDKAIVEYKKVLEAQPANQTAISGIFDAAMTAINAAEKPSQSQINMVEAKESPDSYLKLAEQFAAVAKRENLDLCNGEFFMARLAVAKKDYKEALSRLDSVLKQRPIFSLAYTLRSSVQSDLGDATLAIEDARKAVQLNPLDGMSSKNLANLLYQRNLKLGQNVSAEQVAEMRTAIQQAYTTNPQEWQLLSLYAEYISDTEPMQALAIRQRLQNAIPTVQNAVLLGNLAAKIASEQKDAAKKKAYLEMAGSAYEQGYKLDPTNPSLLRSYADFYRLNGNPDKATELLNKSSNKNILWAYQIQHGQFTQAKIILDKLYQENPKDVNVLKGLLIASQNLGDAQSATKYSQELLSYEDTPGNQLGQIEAFLRVGLVEQAEKKLTSFKERYPNDDRTILLQAWVAIGKGQFSEALSYLELKPNDATSLDLKGQIDFSRGDYEKAIDDFKKAKTISPTLQMQTNLARAYMRAGRGDDAVNELLLAIDTVPEASELYSMLEETYMQLHKTDALSSFYANTIKKFPTNPFWYNRAASFAISQKNLDSASSLSRAALELSQKSDPNMPKEALLQQARIALDNYLTVMLLNKQYDQLIVYASQYVDGDLAYVAFVKMADAKAAIGDKAKAVEYYHNALKKGGENDSVVFAILGRMTDTIGRDETIKWCTTQLQSTPNSLPINLAMCNLLRMNKENNKALTYIDKCLQLAGPKSSSHKNFLDIKQAILVELYTATSDSKYLDEAVKLYENFIAESSSIEVGALNNLAYLLADNNRDIDKALDYIKKAYDAVQNNPNILDTYSYVLYKKGDYAKASEKIQSATQMFEKSSVSAPADVYTHLGMIKAKLGRKNEALTAYNQALKVGDKTLSDAAKQRIKTDIEALK